jgi:hypothetical protein
MKVTRVASYSVPRTASLKSPSADQILRSDGGIVPIPYLSPPMAYARNSGEIQVWLDSDPPFSHYGGITGRLADHRDGLVYAPNRYVRHLTNILKDTVAEMKPLFKVVSMDLEFKGASKAGDALLDFYEKALEWGEKLAGKFSEAPEQVEREKLIAGLAKDIGAAGGLCLPYVDLVSVSVDVIDLPFYKLFNGPTGAFLRLEFESADGKRRRIAVHAALSDTRDQKVFVISTNQGAMPAGKKPEQRQPWHEALALGFMNARAMAELAATQAMVSKNGLSREAIAKEVLSRMGDAATALLALPSKPLVPNILANYRAAYASIC